MMTHFYSTFATALGPFSLAVDASGALTATAFGELDMLMARVPVGRWLPDAQRTSRSREQIIAYLAGERQHFDLPRAASGSAFQLRVWEALATIPYGRTRSYGELARELGTAARAVGKANATNPLCLVVPCHRVIGADGTLTGYAFGEPLKQALLALEGHPVLRGFEPRVPCSL